MAGEVPQPHVVIIAGQNGAGNSAAAPDRLQDVLAVTESVNADVIAHGNSARFSRAALGPFRQLAR